VCYRTWSKSHQQYHTQSPTHSEYQHTHTHDWIETELNKTNVDDVLNEDWIKYCMVRSYRSFGSTCVVVDDDVLNEDWIKYRMVRSYRLLSHKSKPRYKGQQIHQVIFNVGRGNLKPDVQEVKCRGDLATHIKALITTSTDFVPEGW
jgi:hypothetical protein